MADDLRAEALVALRDALRVHHPIMRSETGPFSGCRCGQVQLGQDVIAHVVQHLSASAAVQEALAAADAVKRVEALADELSRWRELSDRIRRALDGEGRPETADPLDAAYVSDDGVHFGDYQ